MYGASRKVNAAQVRELVGAAQYAECTRAMIATDGELLKEALEIARSSVWKLGMSRCPPIPRRGPSRSNPRRRRRSEQAAGPSGGSGSTTLSRSLDKR
jgi:hypothetical protein